MDNLPIGPGGSAVSLTPEGGVAYWIENQTGEVSVKGKLVETGAAVDNSVALIGLDDPDPIGVIYDAGIAVGEQMRVVFSGRAQVLFGNTPTRHYFARNAETADGVAAGTAVSEVVPVPPFATDKHFMEIGHIFETLGAPGLALVNLHFN